MEDPVRDAPGVVHKLTQGSPKLQQETIDTYFTQNATFIHPFCRTVSFDGSRVLLQFIYRWYKIMSPQIDLKVNSVGKRSHMLMTNKIGSLRIPSSSL